MYQTIRKIFKYLIEIWNRCWFYKSDTIPLEVIRIGVGFLLFINYFSFSLDELKFFYTNEGMIPLVYNQHFNESVVFSLLFHTEHLWQFYVVYGILLCACFSLMVGWKTSIVKWIVLIGQISFLYRNPLTFYGFDCVSCNLLLILCFAPIGTALSFDRIRYLKRLKYDNIEAWAPPPKGPWTSACIRLMQLQMAIAFFYAGAYKLQGDIWWSGEALWYALTHVEFNNIPLTLFTQHFWIINLLTYTALFVELSYPFLIWEKKTRPYFLAAAILLHVGIAVSMGLYLFSSMMICGHLSFFSRDWYTYLKIRWKKLVAPIEIIYDGRCNFCLHSMIFLLSFDGLRQLSLRDYRINPSPRLKFEDQDREIHIISKDHVLWGFDAYRYMVVRIPGLWWLIPLFYVPFFSKFIGRPLYRWIAARRSAISTCFVHPSTKKKK